MKNKKQKNRKIKLNNSNIIINIFNQIYFKFIIFNIKIKRKRKKKIKDSFSS